MAEPEAPTFLRGEGMVKIYAGPSFEHLWILHAVGNFKPPLLKKDAPDALLA